MRIRPSGKHCERWASLPCNMSAAAQTSKSTGIGFATRPHCHLKRDRIDAKADHRAASNFPSMTSAAGLHTWAAPTDGSK